MPASQSVHDANSQPLSTAELESANKECPDADHILIDDDNGTNEYEEDEKSRVRSDVWNHFDRKKIDGSLKAICKYCKKKLKGDPGSGTSHLRNHFMKKHKRPEESIKQKLLAKNFNKDQPELSSYSFSHEEAKKELAKMIIMHEYPISIVDHIGFKRYSARLQPLFKVPSRNTIKNEIFQVYEYEKAKTATILESISSRVAITTDMWTASNQKKGYMAVTAHFIDESWTLQSCIMRFIYVPCPHTKEVLCDQLLECLMDWNMDRKLSCLTVDNCSTNDAMVESLLEKLDSSSLIAGGSLFHMRCAAHILNLIVKDGLDVIKIGVEKIRDSVAYWTATPKREEKFEETARQLRNTSTKKLGLDCATRWNSTYLMLETALLYKDVFKPGKNPDPIRNPLDRVWILFFKIQPGLDRVWIWYRKPGLDLDISKIQPDPTRCHP